LTENSHVSL